jgi:hypothetical protein
MKSLMIAVVTLALASPGLAQQAGTQAQQEQQRREMQQKMRELEQQMRELQREMARLEPESRATVRARAITPGPMLKLFGSRGRLGVNVATPKNPATDSIGAVLASVTPSGPADQAGLKAGDIITTFNGEKLAGRYPAAGERESEPARKLVDFAQQLEEGDSVRIDYRRGKDTFTTPDVHVETAPMIATLEGLRGGLMWSSGWLDLELVALNPELGEYFGTTDGLLVIHAPDDSELQVKGGDVILSVDGRPVGRPART